MSTPDLLHHLLFRAADASPDSVAVVDGGRGMRKGTGSYPGMIGKPVIGSTAVLLWNPRVTRSVSATGNAIRGRSRKFDSTRWPNLAVPMIPTSSPFAIPLLAIEPSLSRNGPKVL